jgi:Spx/MgsR family transcriptional regulator
VKAKQLLGTKDVTVHERLYFKQKPSLDEVRDLVSRLPGGPAELLSTRSRRYKELDLASRQLTEEEMIRLLAEEPGLWRRPVIIRGEKVVIGYDAKSLEELLS